MRFSIRRIFALIHFILKPLQLRKNTFLILIIGAAQGWSQEGSSNRSNPRWTLLPGVSLTYPQIISVPISLVRLGSKQSLTPILQLEPGLGGNKVKLGVGGNPGFKTWSGIFGKVSLLNIWPIIGNKTAVYWGGEIQLSLLYLHFDLGYYADTPFNMQQNESLISASIGFGL